MRHITLMTTATLVASFLFVSSVSAQSPSVDDIVALHLKARGGAEKVKSIQSQRLSGVIYTQGLEIAMASVTRKPNLGRQDLTLDIPGQGPISIVNVFDGTTAWTVNPMMGATAVEITGRDADNIRDQSEIDSPLIDYRAKGHTVELVGTEMVGDRRAHHLKVTRPGRGVASYFVDAETGAELRIATEGADASVVELSDHRNVDGVLVPFRIRVMQAGQLQAEIAVSSVEFNVPADDALFRKP
jgi:hypothetical protein